MRTGCFTCFLSITLLIILCFTNIPAHSQCLKDQKSVLLQFKNNTDFDRNFSVKLVNWTQSSDCCQWMGVSCDQSGHVIGLDLSMESISGPIDSSLQNLQFLSKINLRWNTLSAPVPDFFANFANLTALSLVDCDLRGTFPAQILQVKTLQTLDLSYNDYLQGSLPNFNHDGSLQNLILSHTNFSGILLDSIGNLRQLSRIEIFNCSFSGPIPNTLANFTQLVYLDLSYNSFNGPIPNTLTNLTQLVYLDLSHNSFNGSIPSSLFSLPSLKQILLSSNQFSNFSLFPIGSLSPLDTLDLSDNKLDVSVNISSLSSFSQLTYLGLASCNLHNFPALMNQSQISVLDLSDNQILGLIPNWIWNIGNLRHLNLSGNFLVGLQSGYVPSSFGLQSGYVLDLHSNQFRGEIPLPPKEFAYVDYSNNNFSSIPAEINMNGYFFSLSNNMLSGPIPQSICSSVFIQVLDLSNNNLTGTIPQCLIDTHTMTLDVLNLQNNNLTGNINGTFPEGCALTTLDLSGNHLEGRVPKSLVNCTNMEVLNLGTNNINGNFPCFLTKLSSLRILILRSNKFQENIRCRGIHNNIWPKLQIIDLAVNNFTGILPPKFFLHRKAMMDRSNAQLLNHSAVWATGYHDSVIFVNKGSEMKLVKILTIFTVIDFSENNFEGEIPDSVGDLKSLYVLNLSHNGLTGSIPSSFGNLTELESLDLSWNKLNGSIPTTLASLTFLSFLNLSYNQLVGMIPRGPQLQTFSETSFEGNEGLCGAPLIATCRKATKSSMATADEGEINWVYIAATLGYTVGLGAIVGPLLYWKRWRECYYKHVDRVVFKILDHHEKWATHQRRRDNKNLIRRRQHC